MSNLSRIEALSQAADFITQNVANKSNGYVRDDMSGEKRWQLIVEAAEFLLKENSGDEKPFEEWRDELVELLTRTAAEYELTRGDAFLEGFKACIEDIGQVKFR